MGKYTDRMGDRLESQGKANTVRVVFRLVVIAIVIVALIWLFKWLQAGLL